MRQACSLHGRGEFSHPPHGRYICQLLGHDTNFNNMLVNHCCGEWLVIYIATCRYISRDGSEVCFHVPM